jgi:hypothetical protein
VESNSEGEGEGKGDDAEEEDNEVTEFWLELAWIQLFVLVLGRTCQSGMKTTMKMQNTKARGGSELRLEAARPLADDRVLRCVFVVCSRLLSLQHGTGASSLELSLDRRRSSCAI